MDKIAIIGTGLIGTSLGLAIKESAAKTTEVVGTDLERSHLSTAQKMGAVDRTETVYRKAVEDAQVVIICTPVMAIRGVMEDIAPYLKPGCLVTDTGSTKSLIMKWAAELLPKEVSFVGGHPMAGRETSGPDGANGSLFRGKVYCLMPSPTASAAAVNALVGLVQSIGARHYFMDPQEHDSYVAAVSHLPVLAAVGLVRCASGSPSWEDIAKVASTGFRDTTRLASGDPVMHRDICVTNGEMLLPWIDSFIRELYELRQRVIKASQGDGADITEAFEDALTQRGLCMAGNVKGPSQRVDRVEPLPTFGEQMGQLLLGNKLMEQQKRIMQSLGWGDAPPSKGKDDKSS